MNHRRFGILLAITVALAPVFLWAAEKATQGILGEGTPWATAYYVRDSSKEGPTVVITGGMHGDEPAGARAADQIRSWAITTGKVIVIPRANEPALRAGTRLMPTLEDPNLNRNFPQAPNEVGKGELARALWVFVCTARPSWVVDLHEGLGVHQQAPRSTGSSIVADPGLVTVAQARRMLEAVNATVAEPDRQFVLLRGPVRGSLACAAAERLGAHALILETTDRGQPLARRVRQHRLMVHRLLSDLGMLPADAPPEP